jgi:hypothetical protein
MTQTSMAGGAHAPPKRALQTAEKNKGCEERAKFPSRFRVQEDAEMESAQRNKINFICHLPLFCKFQQR